MKYAHYRKGSNQYSKKPKFIKKGTWATLGLIGIFFFIPVVYLGHSSAEASEPMIVSPVPLEGMFTESVSTSIGAPMPSVTMAPLSEQEKNIRIIKKIWGKDWKTGVAIASCESGLNSKAINNKNTNGSSDYGLFQINTIHGWTEDEMLNPIANAGVAYSKFVAQGTNPWYSSEKCWKNRI